MALEWEVLDSSTSVVLVGWRILEESIADRTTAAALSMMAWPFSGGRLGTGGVGAGLCVLFAAVLAKGLVGGCTCGVVSSPERFVCWIRADTWATNSVEHFLGSPFQTLLERSDWEKCR